VDVDLTPTPCKGKSDTSNQTQRGSSMGGARGPLKSTWGKKKRGEVTKEGKDHRKEAKGEKLSREEGDWYWEAHLLQSKTKKRYEGEKQQQKGKKKKKE